MANGYFILGGARSGKSNRALQLALEIGSKPVFLATAEALDAEMSDRIAKHKDERGSRWTTLDAPLDIVNAIKRAAQVGDVCVVDCLTLWLSNLMHHERSVSDETDRFCKLITAAPIPIILVSNEVGMGLVPDTPLGRAFRDEQGRLNQAVARACKRVEFVAAGLPLTLKG